MKRAGTCADIIGLGSSTSEAASRLPALVVSVPLLVSHLPTVGLSLGYSHYDNIKLKGTAPLDDGSTYAFKETINGNSPMALLSVSIPLFHWGAEFKKVKKARLGVENARLQLQQSERGMRIEMRQAVQNLTDGQRIVKI